MCVLQSESKKIVVHHPETFFFLQEKDSYNNEVMKIARPLPLEYMIIDVPTGFPSADAQIQLTFNDNCAAIKTRFVVENRMQIGELQDMNALATYLQQFSKSGGAGATTTSTNNRFQATDILGDIHLLRYLALNDIFPFSMVRTSNVIRSSRRSRACTSNVFFCCFFFFVESIGSAARFPSHTRSDRRGNVDGRSGLANDRSSSSISE